MMKVIKQETLEEVAERLKDKELFKESNDRAKGFLSKINKQETLEEAAKEIFKEEYICNGIDIAPAWREGFVTGAKWQQEQDKNKYSEEEVYVILEKFKNLPLIQFQDWLEQFKNK